MLDGSPAGSKVVVNGTEYFVIGLTPGVLYTISVSSENDVSSQDNNINDRSATITLATGKLSILYFKCTESDA